MGLRLATAEDQELIKNMGMQFINSIPYQKHTSEDKINMIATEFAGSDRPDKVAILYDDVAMLLGVATPFLFGTKLCAVEIAWWVDPEYRKSNIGRELLEAFEYWAKKVGCELVTMISLDERVGKFYEKNGYVLTEHTYMKEI